MTAPKRIPHPPVGSPWMAMLLMGVVLGAVLAPALGISTVVEEPTVQPVDGHTTYR